MSYLESAESQIITYKRAIQEIKHHHASIDEFIEAFGRHITYKAVDVLHWLGY